MDEFMLDQTVIESLKGFVEKYKAATDEQQRKKIDDEALEYLKNNVCGDQVKSYYNAYNFIVIASTVPNFKEKMMELIREIDNGFK